MDLVLDASVQLIQLGLLFILVTLNVGLRRRLKAIEARLGAIESKRS
jgi:hypothetical protein